MTMSTIVFHGMTPLCALPRSPPPRHVVASLRAASYERSMANLALSGPTIAPDATIASFPKMVTMV